jgi:hypothetical protein
MPNKVKKVQKREDDLKALGVYPENPDETAVDLLEEENIEGLSLLDDTSTSDEEEEVE